MGNSKFMIGSQPKTYTKSTVNNFLEANNLSKTNIKDP